MAGLLRLEDQLGQTGLFTARRVPMPNPVGSRLIERAANGLELIFRFLDLPFLQGADQFLDPITDDGTGRAIPEAEFLVLLQSFNGAFNVRHNSVF